MQGALGLQKVLEYIGHVKDASKDRAQCEIETLNLYSLLVNLRCRLEEGSASQPWYLGTRLCEPLQSQMGRLISSSSHVS